MRMFGLIGLVAVLLIVGLLVGRQSGGGAAMVSPATGAASAASVRSQGLQLQEEVRHSLDAAARQGQHRSGPDSE
jgi:hypothetical protein